MKIVLVVTLLVAFTFATAAQMKALSTIDSTHLGNTVLSAIAVQLNTGGPMEDIIAVLTESKIALSTEGQEAESQYNTVVATCTTCKAKHVTNIQVAEAQLVKQRQILAISQTELASAKASLSENEGRLEDKEGELEKKTQQRADNLAAFQQREFEHSEALSAIDDAIAAFSKIKTVGQVSLIQTSMSTFQDKVDKVFQRKTALKATYAPMLMSLAALKTNADPASIEKIMTIMHKIKTALTTSKQEDRSQEEQAAANWEVEKASIQQTIADLKSTVHNLKTEIQRLEDLIDATLIIIAQEEKILAQEQQLLADETTWCQEEDEIYNATVVDRKNILDLINQVIAVVEDSFNQVESYLSDRVNTADKFIPSF